MMRRMISGIFAAFVMASISTFAHSDKEIGPNGGRILEFSTNQTLHGEVTLTNGIFYVGILDKDMKKLSIREQSLTVTGGSRSNPEKPTVEKRGDHFSFPALTGNRYLLVLEFQENAAAKPIIARFEFDEAICNTCRKGEWLCDCHIKKPAVKGGAK